MGHVGKETTFAKGEPGDLTRVEAALDASQVMSAYDLTVKCSY